jgi:hypothetical protein
MPHPAEPSYSGSSSDRKFHLHLGPLCLTVPSCTHAEAVVSQGEEDLPLGQYVPYSYSGSSFHHEGPFLWRVGGAMVFPLLF